MSAIGSSIGEPGRSGGRGGYFAIAKLESLEPDRTILDHWYAIMSGYIEFDTVIPLCTDDGFYEPYLAALAAPAKLGAALQGRSVRTIDDAVFDRIVRDGFQETLSPSNVVRLGLDSKEAGPKSRRFFICRKPINRGALSNLSRSARSATPRFGIKF